MPGPRATTRARRAPAVAIVVSRYNATITDELERGAISALRARRGKAALDRLEIVNAPGAFELPVLAHAAASTGRFDGVLALGCIIKGDTIHDRVIADAVAQGLTRVALDTGVPCALGVLTVNTPAQARARAGGAKGHKGEEAMEALLFTIAAVHAVRRRPSRRRAPRPLRPDKAARAAGAAR